MSPNKNPDHTAPPDHTNPVWAQKVRHLVEALPFMRRYNRAVIVVKYGGAAINPETLAQFAQNIALIQQTGAQPVVIHGGGPSISQLLKKLSISSQFIGGLRQTSPEAADAAEMALNSINKRIVSALHLAQCLAVGLSGKDAQLLTLKPAVTADKQQKPVNLGQVGSPERVNPLILNTLLKQNIVPVISPVGADKNGETLNVNADDVAGAVAAALHAKRLLLLTNVAGVLDKNQQLIPELSPQQALKLIDADAVNGGMLPKLLTCTYAVQNNVDAAVILNGANPDAMLAELFTDKGAGTLVRNPS